MKKITLLLGVFMATTMAKAQGLEGIVVEKYYHSNAADSINADAESAVTPLPVGSVTYRVYADMAVGYRFLMMFGNVNHALKVSSTKDFYNDPNNGVSVYANTSTANTRKNTTMIDSYITVGGVAAGKMGVLKTEDTDGSIGNAQSILADTCGGVYGFPINGTNGVDGMLAGTPITANVLGIAAELDIFDQTAGKSFSTNSGAISALGGASGVTASNMILLGQFTTAGDFSYEINLQVQNGSNAAELYVVDNPVMNGQIQEQSIPSLKGTILAPIAAVNTSSLNEIKNTKTAVSIFPNPVKDDFTIIIENGRESESGKYTIQDVTGKVLAENKMSVLSNQFSKKVDISNLPSGVYFVNVNVNNSVYTSKIIKQ